MDSGAEQECPTVRKFLRDTVYTPADGEDAPRARIRFVSPRFFSVPGIPLVAGREFTAADRRGLSPRIRQRRYTDVWNAIFGVVTASSGSVYPCSNPTID